MGSAVNKHQIIYIGKTESSREKRDAKTHFASGKTGSSTVRKSVGSLLCVQEVLTPIPRNNSDYKKGRYSHFKFDNESEDIITNWMKENLALSFYEYPESRELIDELETEIIGELKPVLNIDHKNRHNPYKRQIKELRANCAITARSKPDFKNMKIMEKSNTKNKLRDSSVSDVIYIDNLSKVDCKSRKIRILVGNKHLFPTGRTVESVTYELDFTVGNKTFVAKYSIGSSDGGVSRSGVLMLGKEIYDDVLNIKPNTSLKISKLEGDKYVIEKV